MSIKLTRRNLMASLGASIAMGVLAKRKLWDSYGPRSYPGKVLGANFKRGHHLLKKNFSKPDITLEYPVIVIGAGVSGLSATYHLTKMGHQDIPLFELEDHLGGNSISYNKMAPWGAHYLPLPNPDNESLISLLKESGSILNHSSETIEFNELHLCSAPMEKLYIHGRLQDGLVPKMGLEPDDQKQIDRFFVLMDAYKRKRGRDQKLAFNIPMEKSSQDPDFLALDNITMHQWLSEKGFTSKELFWYVNYCCRDDYGTTIEEISAWAGIHYFAARRGRGKNSSEDAVLTWPEGNSFLTNFLRKSSSVIEKKAHLLFGVKDNHYDFFDFNSNKTIRVVAKQAVLALPQFVLARAMNRKSPQFSYSPWMVANIKIKWDLDLERSLAWDNVNYHGKGLGFVSANHQSLKQGLNENTLTYYWPLTDKDPVSARKWAIGRTHEQWSRDIINDLSPMIFDIKERIKEIQVWPWGHAMIRPTQNFLFGKRKENVIRDGHNFVVAHTDLSGLSLFEEGFYRGEMAATKIHERLKDGKG